MFPFDSSPTKQNLMFPMPAICPETAQPPHLRMAGRAEMIGIRATLIERRILR